MAALTALMIGSMIYGAVSSTVSHVKAGNAAKRAGEAAQDSSNDQAALETYNAQVAALQAQDATVRGAEDEARFRTGVKLLIGSQRAGIAAGNIDVGFGSALDVQADSAFLGELDALTIRTNAAREAWGYKVQGEDLTRRAAILQKEGVQQAKAGKEGQSASRWAAAGTVVGAVGDASMLARQYGFGNKSSSSTIPTIASRQIKGIYT